MQWETVIGLEVHIQLATRSKIFSGSATAFGAEPNTQANAIDLALPGTLPVLNEGAVRSAILFGLAIDAEIGRRSVFERKNYFYPDLPKGYQTTQLAEPIVGPGHVDIELANGHSKRVRIHHAHLEEDAGKSLHETFFDAAGHGMTGIDLNRAGTPLIEVVTEPDMRSAEEAVACARKLHAIVTTLGICDGDMSQGSMRFDVNISVRPLGSEVLGTRTETKNLNSFRFMEDAIALEVARQIEVLEDGGSVVQETRLYNGDTGVARGMRSKEEANDYRYFPCPDLLPVEVSETLIEELRAQLPELPDQRRERFVREYGLPAYDAGVLTAERATADYFEACARASGEPKLAANWVMGEVAARLNQHDLAISDCPVTPEQLAQLIARIKDGTLSGKLGKQVFDLLWQGKGDDVDALIHEHGLEQVSDTGAIEALVDAVLAEQADIVAQYAAADEKKRKKLKNSLVGPVMKASKGQANPQVINELLTRKLDGG